MTTTTDLTQHRIDAEVELHRIAEELSRAKQDAEIFARLKAAPDLVKRLGPLLSTAQDALTVATAAERQALEEARFANLLDIDVRVNRQTADEHVLRASFEITYTRLAWSDVEGANVPTKGHANGFSELPDDIFAYLISKHPGKIPAKIMALAPGDPEAAFDRYFVALRRGFIRQ